MFLLLTSSCASFPSTPTYGPAAQTVTQRAYVLEQMRQANPASFLKLTPYVAHLHVRYVAGELSWTQVQALREAGERPSVQRGWHAA